jgi:hypothetical protein
VSAAVSRLARFDLTTADAQRLTAFYEAAFDCRRLGSRRLSGAAFEKSMDVEGGAESFTLGLGSQRIGLLQFDSPGRPYPMEASASDPIFQHFAIVVADIQQAYQRLLGVA